jgi:RNA polymerase sigma-70 factor (ECF subfamily)
MMNGPCPFEDRVRRAAERLAESGVAALGGLFDLTSQRLVRFATTITRNQHDAEDAVQASLMRCAARPRLLRDAKRPWPYLLQVVRNEALAAARKQRRWSLAAGLIDLCTRREVDELEQEETHRAVWQALRRLPVAQSEVVVLKIWEGLTFAEIGEVLEISPCTAASRYRYGMEKLERLLGVSPAEARHES